MVLMEEQVIMTVRDIKWVLLFFVGCVYAECEVAARFCFYPSENKDSTYWIAGVYERNVPLGVLFYTKGMDKEIVMNVTLIPGAKVNTDNSRFFFCSVSGFKGENLHDVPCDRNMYENVYSYFESAKFMDSTQIAKYFDSYQKLKWNVKLSFKEHKQNWNGEHVVYISGFCTNEQMKEIKKIKEEFSLEKKMHEDAEADVRWNLRDKIDSRDNDD